MSYPDQITPPEGELSGLEHAQSAFNHDKKLGRPFDGELLSEERENIAKAGRELVAIIEKCQDAET